MRHTPGPWTAGGWSSGQTPIIAADIHKQCGRTVALVPCEFRGFIGFHSGNDAADYEGETTKANARLIAAAPLLLAACKASEEFLQVIGNPAPPAPWRQLVDAIARAEGELVTA